MRTFRADQARRPLWRGAPRPTRSPCAPPLYFAESIPFNRKPRYRSSGSAAFVAGKPPCAVLPLRLFFVSESFFVRGLRVFVRGQGQQLSCCRLRRRGLLVDL
ncbi:hypothetical protein PVAP13_2NG472800 [Panicum virgatum]|uniref:Uncharacterized protein n=1 Tax=Panicum virgatum TaxID=38727 RepID=A0A8T0VNF4_PANVG|nr:hypothetical protein PVAP13_2NG472800 [Panicum virgatum]